MERIGKIRNLFYYHNGELFPKMSFFSGRILNSLLVDVFPPSDITLDVHYSYWGDSIFEILKEGIDIKAEISRLNVYYSDWEECYDEKLEEAYDDLSGYAVYDIDKEAKLMALKDCYSLKQEMYPIFIPSVILRGSSMGEFHAHLVERGKTFIKALRGALLTSVAIDIVEEYHTTLLKLGKLWNESEYSRIVRMFKEERDKFLKMYIPYDDQETERIFRGMVVSVFEEEDDEEFDFYNATERFREFVGVYYGLFDSEILEVIERRKESLFNSAWYGFDVLFPIDATSYGFTTELPSTYLDEYTWSGGRREVSRQYYDQNGKKFDFEMYHIYSTGWGDHGTEGEWFRPEEKDFGKDNEFVFVVSKRIRTWEDVYNVTAKIYPLKPLSVNTVKDFIKRIERDAEYRAEVTGKEIEEIIKNF